MDKKLKEIIESLNIKEKKKKELDNKNKLFELDRKMAKLKFDRNIGLYAFYQDELLDKNNSVEYLNNIKELLLSYKMSDELKEYIKLRSEYYSLLDNSNYYKTVNIDLRNILSNYELPNIYIKQEKRNINIINKDVSKDDNIIIIYSPFKMTSKRDYRHFYNKKSFKYLELLSNDYSYNLDNKNLGKIKTLIK